MAMFIVHAVVFSYIGLTSGCCPNGWIVHGGSCYLFSMTNATFLDAEQTCVGFQSHLINIGSTSENNFIKSFASALKDNDYYIGLTDLITEGEWQWYDTDSVAQFTDWGSNQPGVATSRNCAVMSSTRNYTWSDVGCSDDFRFICEMRQSPDFEIVG